MRIVSILFSFIFIIFFSGCSKKNPRKSNKHLVTQDACSIVEQEMMSDLGSSLWVENTNNKNAPYSIRQTEAQLIDVPIPLQAVPLSFHDKRTSLQQPSSDSLVLAYTVNWQYEDICSFFTKEMERLGWDNMAHIKDVESLLVFVKPTKVCTISLRNSAQPNSFLMILSYGNNKASYSVE